MLSEATMFAVNKVYGNRHRPLSDINEQTALRIAAALREGDYAMLAGGRFSTRSDEASGNGAAALTIASALNSAGLVGWAAESGRVVGPYSEGPGSIALNGIGVWAEAIR